MTTPISGSRNSFLNSQEKLQDRKIKQSQVWLDRQKTALEEARLSVEKGKALKTPFVAQPKLSEIPDDGKPFTRPAFKNNPLVNDILGKAIDEDS
ncbi:MAG: hypothetical protein J0L93_04155 [Deltaproteobacteria bacterium]|nr:hypothetical protein [Deltaproteobacteria bacterium]